MNETNIPEVSLQNLDTGEKVVLPVKVVRPRAKFNLICASKVKRYALDIAKSNPCEQRAKMFTRVSEDFLLLAEGALKNWIRDRVRSQPSKGKTLT